MRAIFVRLPVAAVPAMMALAPRPDTTTTRARIHDEPGATLRARVRGERPASEASAERSPVLATAARYVGTPYRLGGTTPRAFDCSGFVRFVFARHGVDLPRTAREQVAVGRAVTGGLDSLRAGDLLFFRTRRGRAGHVALYVGNGIIIHASAGSRRVRYDDLGSTRGRWFVRNLSALRRVMDDPPPIAISASGS